MPTNNLYSVNWSALSKLALPSTAFSDAARNVGISMAEATAAAARFDERVEETVHDLATYLALICSEVSIEIVHPPPPYKDKRWRLG